MGSQSFCAAHGTVQAVLTSYGSIRQRSLFFRIGCEINAKSTRRSETGDPSRASERARGDIADTCRLAQDPQFAQHRSILTHTDSGHIFVWTACDTVTMTLTLGGDRLCVTRANATLRLQDFPAARSRQTPAMTLRAPGRHSSRRGCTCCASRANGTE